MADLRDNAASSRLATYWRRVLVLTGSLIAAWLLVTVLPLVLTITPESWRILGWPFAYAVVAFGAPLAYLLLIWIYAFVMNRHDQAFRESDD